MAAPPEITITNYSGKYVMDKSLSDDIDAMLVMQGVGWLTRKAIGLATVVLTIEEYKKNDIWNIDITSLASGVSTTREERILDFEDRDHTDKVFGKVKGRSRLIRTADYEMVIDQGTAEDATFLQGLKLKDGKDSKFLDDELVQSYVESIDGRNWRAEQVWGFEEINGVRKHTRRVVCRKGDKVERVRLIYDYKGPIDTKVEG